jgi:hypothetical protein
MNPSRLTPFQSLMRGWAKLAPYNFIHALQLDAPAVVQRWRAAAEAALHPLGFAATDVVIEQSGADIETQLNAELNRPFAADAAPLRFFVLGNWVGVTIDHWIADDFGSRALLERMHASYCGGAELPPLHWERPSTARAGWLREWKAFVRQAAAMRRAVRTPLHDPLDLSAEAFRAGLPDAALPEVRRFAKEHEATVHDVFLAAAAQTFGTTLPARAGARRNAVALTSAVNLRRFERDQSSAGFGLMTGDYSIIAPRPHDLPLPELVRRISQQTRRLKTSPGTEHLGPALLLSRLAFSRKAEVTLFHRGSPYAAALSNVNLTGSWIERAGITDFRRVGPTGPVVPVLLMITTLHGRISIDVTFRTTAYSRTRAEELLADFAQRLQFATT